MDEIEVRDRIDYSGDGGYEYYEEYGEGDGYDVEERERELRRR